MKSSHAQTKKPAGPNTGSASLHLRSGLARLAPGVA